MNFIDDMPLPPTNGQPNTQSQGNSQSFTSDMPAPPDQSGMDKTISSLQALKEGDHANRFKAINDTSNSLGASTMAFIDTFNKQMSDLPQGIMQGLGLNNFTLGKPVDQQHADLEQNAEIARQNHPVAAGLGDAAGFVGNAINATAMGEGVAAGTGLSGLIAGNGLGANMGRSAATGAFYGGTQYVDPGQSREFNTGLGALVGGAAPVASQGIKLAVNDVAKPLMDVANKMYDPGGVALGDVVD